MALADADSVPTTANEASIVKIITSPPSSLLPPTDSSLAGTTPSRVTPQDLETLAEDAVQLTRISDLNESDPAADVDLDKVAVLRQSIADGSFQIDSEAIYTSLVAEAREMLGSEPT